MENQNQNTKVIFPADDSSNSVISGQSSVQPLSLDTAPSPMPLQPLVAGGTTDKKPDSLFARLIKRADVVLAILLLLGSAGLVFSAYTDDKQDTSNAVGKYDTTKIPLDQFATFEGIDFGTQSVTINGGLRTNDGLIIAPTLQPTSAVAGQMYYDQTTNVLAYYNGTQFVPVSGEGSSVQSVAGLTGNIAVGAGLSSAGGQLSNTGVLTVQGQTGNVTLTAGNGISIAGTTIANSGIISVSSSSPSLTVTNDGNGNITLSGSGAGTVSSPGGTSGQLALFTGPQTIEDSIVSQSGMTVTVAGDLAVVTGGLTLSNALSVSNGGTGATSLALNGVLVGQGTGAITSVAAGGAGLCLVSTAGAPTWSVCPGGVGVDSLNGLTGALNIANASGAGSTITIDNASTSTKGIAQFNATNFSVGSGIVNTVQNINTGATPTFAGVNTNNITPSGALTVGATSQILTLQGNGGTTITATNGANTTTVGFSAPSATATINFPALSAGTYDICTTSGNCLGGGGGGANTALSNLTGVAINTTLLPGSAGGVSLGSGTLPFGDLFLAGTSGTPGTNNFRITGASTGGTRTITIPDSSGTVCLTTGNCTGVGGGVTTIGGTIGTLPVFTGAQAIGDSLVSQSGGVVSINGHLDLTAGNQYRINGTQISSANLSNDANLAKLSASQTFTGATNAFQNGANSTNAFNVQNAAGSRLLTVDTSNGEVELGAGSLVDGKLVFNNVSNNNTVTVAPGTPTGNRTITLPDDSGVVCLNTGNCAGAGSTLQTAYNFSVGGTTPKIKVNSTLGGVDIQDADTTIGANLFNVRASNGGGLGSVMLGVASTGATTLQNATNSTTALRVLSSGGTSVLTVDTTNGQTLLGQSGTLAGSLLFRNATNSNTGTLTTAVLGQNTTFTLPDPVAASAEICLNTGNCLGGGGGANTALSNLTGVAINTTLLPGSAGAINVGSGTLPFGDLFLAGSSGTPGTNNFRITGASTGGTRTITLPDASGTVCLQNSTACGFFLQNGNSFGATAVLGTNDGFDLDLERGGATKLTVGANNVTLASNIDLILQGATAFISNTQGQSSSEAFGNNATVGSTSALAVGNNATATGQFSTAVGDGTEAAFASIAIGRLADASGQQSTALGAHTSATFFGSIAIGEGATTTAANQLVIGNTTADGSEINQVYIGSGVTDVTPTSVVIQGTGGSGANVAGASVTLAGGQGTGTGNGGSINFQIADPGVSGSALNSLSTVLSLSGINGAATFQNSTDSSTGFRVLNAAASPIFTINTSTPASTFNSSLSVFGTTALRPLNTDLASLQVDNDLGASLFRVDNQVGQVKIGNYLAGDGTAVLFVLDEKDTAGDPVSSLTNGSMYYNSNLGKFRCYENSTWKDCISAAAAGTPFVQDGNSFGGAATLGTNDTNSLSFETDGTARATFGATGGLTLLSGNAMTVASALTSLTSATSGDALNVSNSTSTGNIALFKDNATNVLTIADGGITTFQPTSASTTAFRVLDTDGTTVLLGVDSSGNNLFTNGNLVVDLNAQVGQDLTVDDQGFFGGNTNTTEALVVYNTTNTVFQVDGQNSRVYIGNPVGDTTGALLVLDTKTTSGDPTGVDGAMYYNSSMGMMRCYYGGQWRFCNEPISMTWGFNMNEDFIGQGDATTNGLYGDFGWNSGVVSGGVVDDVVPDLSYRPGQVQIGTGVTNNAGANAEIYLSSNGTGPILAGANQESEIAINPASTATDYRMRVGLCDTSPSVNCNNGIFMEYNPSLSANWRIGTASGGVNNITNSSTAFATGWVRLKMVVNSAATSVEYFVNDVSIGTVSATIPTGTASFPTLTVNKLSAHTNNRTVKIDYYQIRNSVTTKR